MPDGTGALEEDDQWFDDGPDPGDLDAWFRCVRCRRRTARPALTVFAVEAVTDRVTAAYDLCGNYFSERMGLGSPACPPPRYHPDDQEARP